MNLEALKYPIGKFNDPTDYSEKNIENWISNLEAFPDELKMLTSGLNVSQLNLTYRMESWTIKQLVHHLADSHMNSFIRFKLALTEQLPIIKPYHEALWAKLSDGDSNHIEDSLSLITALHHKWVYLAKSLSDDQLQRAFIHPEHEQQITLKKTLALYSWHCKHHMAHIHNALESEGNFNTP